MKKKVLAMILTAVCTMGLMAGCGNSNVGNTNTQKNASSAEDGYKIGISQFAEHGSLDNCREGFLEGLKEEGIEEGKNLTVDYQNAQTDTGTASTIADSFVSAKEDLICAIATPCAQSAYNSAMNADIPVVYTAVSDPVAAKLANEDGSCVGNVTGSSDVLPVEEQLKMIRAMLPDAKKIGILYTTSETNSCSTVKEYQELAGKYDFEIVDTGINTSADIDMAATDLVSKVDCLCNLTDNTVVNALQTVLDKANNAKIPVFGSEIEQVKSGCVASMGIDYYQLVCNGTTGKMVWKSSNPKVATVDKKGLVKAIKPGKAMISVSGGNLIGSMTCKVGVSKKITTKQARRKIMAMKKTYKEGLSWTNENRQYFWEATNCQCYGCIALCGEISDKVFGKYAPVTKHSNFSRIKAGDHIRIGNEHSVMVLQKNGNTLTVVEGNYNATVHWGRKITKKELQESGFYVETRY